LFYRNLSKQQDVDLAIGNSILIYIPDYYIGQKNAADYTN